MSDGILNTGQPLRKAITRVDPAELKEYLVLGRLEDVTFFQICQGRTETYEYIKNHITEIDPDISFVLVEGKTISEKATVFDFVTYAQKVLDVTDGFDINDYVIGDFIQEEKETNVETPEYMKIDQLDKIDNFNNSESEGEV